MMVNEAFVSERLESKFKQVELSSTCLNSIQNRIKTNHLKSVTTNVETDVK